jgi:hypothetical protein
MKFIELTNDNGQKLLINLSKIECIKPRFPHNENKEEGCYISFNKDNDLNIVKESYDYIKHLIDGE